MKTVDKAMNILRQFSLEKLEIGLNDLAKMTGQDKAVTRRILLSLSAHGFVEQNPENKKYFLGHGFLSLARLREATVPMGKAAQNVAEWLSERTNETVHVSIPGRTGMATIAYRLPARGNIINLRPADVYPFHASASGLAYLSSCTEETRKLLFGQKREKLTRFTLVEDDELESKIANTQSRGYACTRNTVEIGVSSVAMPFFSDGNDPAGTIAIAVPDLNLTPEHERFLAEALRAGINKLEHALVGEPHTEHSTRASES
jgi:DNA-binding IclR family transcriptional regulator